MTTMKATIVRLSTVQRAHLAKLAKKLQVNQSNIIRLAIARMAEQEGITSSDKR